MALINIDTVLSETRKRLKTTNVGAGIVLLSYKRDRIITIITLENGMFHLTERGFKESKQTVSTDQLEKQLKKLIKIELPRSRKVRIQKFNNLDELGKTHQKM